VTCGGFQMAVATVAASKEAAPAFLTDVPEVAEMNQYWYSPATIGAMVTEINASFGDEQRIAFLSTPSIYFSLDKTSAVRRNAHIFDYDRQWEASCDHYCFYDYNDALGTLDASLHHTFDCCVVDPPFITRDVWTLYAGAIKLLLKEDGAQRVILTTVGENEAMLREVLGAKLGITLRKTRFMPAMNCVKTGKANLPYQYSLYVNYKISADSPLRLWNKDVPRSFEALNAVRMGDVVATDAATKKERALGGTKLTFEELMEREMAKAETQK